MKVKMPVFEKVLVVTPVLLIGVFTIVLNLHHLAVYLSGILLGALGAVFFLNRGDKD